MTEKEVKDTVISDEQFFEWCGDHIVRGCGKSRKMEECDREVTKCEDCRSLAQAETTWPIAYKAGQESEKAHWAKELEQQVHDAYQGGMQEVVNLINSHALCQTVGLFAKPIPLDVCGWWQACLKERGLK